MTAEKREIHLNNLSYETFNFSGHQTWIFPTRSASSCHWFFQREKYKLCIHVLYKQTSSNKKKTLKHKNTHFISPLIHLSIIHLIPPLISQNHHIFPVEIFPSYLTNNYLAFIWKRKEIKLLMHQTVVIITASMCVMLLCFIINAASFGSLEENGMRSREFFNWMSTFCVLFLIYLGSKHNIKYFQVPNCMHYRTVLWGVNHTEIQ